MTSLGTNTADVGAVTELVKDAASVHLTEHDIASLAYRLWLDGGCPTGSDQEHWFRAEAILRHAFTQKLEDPSRRPSIPQCNTPTEPRMITELTLEWWDGHWEVWEREWGCARWVWEAPFTSLRISNRAA